MESSEEKVVAVIMVGGPTKGTKLCPFLYIEVRQFSWWVLDFDDSCLLLILFPGTRFRPLSFNTPKPLFPLAGQPMVHHPISACKRVFYF